MPSRTSGRRRPARTAAEHDDRKSPLSVFRSLEKVSDPDYSAIPPHLRDQAKSAWKAGDIEDLLGLMGSHEHFAFISPNIYELVGHGLLERAFVTAYTWINLNAGGLPHWDNLRWLIKFADRKRLLYEGDPLPGKGPFSVYRGVGDGRNKEYVRGLSWTASAGLAAWFAALWSSRVRDGDPAVFEYEVKPESVLFYTNQMSEQEFVIDLPRKACIRRLSKLPEAKPVEGTDEKILEELTWHSELTRYARSIFRCGVDSVHGPQHWRRVGRNGTRLCRHTGADSKVVRLFALLHDCYRRDDGEDRDHGRRAADGLGLIPAAKLDVKPRQLRLLDSAIRHHVDGDVSDDPTIGTCWDADRLDLGRVGIAPDEQYMSTALGKYLASFMKDHSG